MMEHICVSFFKQSHSSGSVQAEGPGEEGAISLKQAFPSLSSHIRNLAPYGEQILLLARK